MSSFIVRSAGATFQLLLPKIASFTKIRTVPTHFCLLLTHCWPWEVLKLREAVDIVEKFLIFRE